MKGTVAVIRSFLVQAPRYGEKWNALTAIAWGLWLLMPPDTFKSGLGATLIGQIAPEDIWGIAGIVVGLLALAASYSEMTKVRVVCGIFLTALWFLLAAVTLSVSTASSGILYAMLWAQQMAYVYDAVADWKQEEG